jgi:hypothetical protein
MPFPVIALSLLYADIELAGTAARMTDAELSIGSRERSLKLHDSSVDRFWVSGDVRFQIEHIP